MFISQGMHFMKMPCYRHDSPPMTQHLFRASVSSAKDKIILLEFIGLDAVTQKEMHSTYPKLKALDKSLQQRQVKL